MNTDNQNFGNTPPASSSIAKPPADSVQPTIPPDIAPYVKPVTQSNEQDKPSTTTSSPQFTKPTLPGNQTPPIVAKPTDQKQSSMLKSDQPTSFTSPVTKPFDLPKTTPQPLSTIPSVPTLSSEPFLTEGMSSADSYAPFTIPSQPLNLAASQPLEPMPLPSPGLAIPPSMQPSSATVFAQPPPSSPSRAVSWKLPFLIGVVIVGGAVVGGGLAVGMRFLTSPTTPGTVAVTPTLAQQPQTPTPTARRTSSGFNTGPITIASPAASPSASPTTRPKR